MIIGEVCLLLSCLLSTVVSTDYCSKSLCGSSKHIACDNDGEFSSDCTSSAKIIDITDDLRTQIVQRHNEYRNQIAEGFDKFSPAARMAAMVWDSELSELAVYNVKQCQMKHDECRSTAKFKYAGQNLAISSWKGMTKSISLVIDNQIKSWFDEYKDASMDNINKYSSASNGKVIGHFTAMIQDKSDAVGCAILRQVNANDFTDQLMACNYAYTNIINSPVYETGAAASNCETGIDEDYKFLCYTNCSGGFPSFSYVLLIFIFIFVFCSIL